MGRFWPAAAFALMCLVVPGLGRAEIIVVNSTIDAPDASPNDGVCRTTFRRCTLRAAIQASYLFENPTIILPAGTYTLTLPGAGEDRGATGDLDLRTVTIVGAGAKTTIVDGGGLDRVFDLVPGAQVDLYGLTIRNGSADNGGGIRNGFDGELTLTDVEVAGNAATRAGGGIYNCAFSIGPPVQLCQFHLVNVTVAENSAAGAGGGIAAIGPVFTLHTVTISGNSAAVGGALYIGPSASLDATIASATIVDNTANEGSGIFLDLNTSATAVNTMVAANLGSDCGGPGTLTSSGHNFDSDATCNLVHPTDLPSAPPLVGPLADNGGALRTHALLAASPAIDAGENGTCARRDQRRRPRPVDGDLDGTATCDVGAYEYEPASSPSGSENSEKAGA